MPANAMGQAAQKATDMGQNVSLPPLPVMTMTGDTKEIEGLFASSLMTDLREKVCKAFDVYNHQMLLSLGSTTFQPEDDAKRLGDLGLAIEAEVPQLLMVVCAFPQKMVGRWQPAPEDDSVWMEGMTVFEDGTFTCKNGEITDGLLRVLSMPERKINFKRTCHDANDHIFTVDEDCNRMVGHCVQSGSTYTLTRVWCHVRFWAGDAIFATFVAASISGLKADFSDKVRVPNRLSDHGNAKDIKRWQLCEWCFRIFLGTSHTWVDSWSSRGFFQWQLSGAGFLGGIRASWSTTGGKISDIWFFSRIIYTKISFSYITYAFLRDAATDTIYISIYNSFAFSCEATRITLWCQLTGVRRNSSPTRGVTWGIQLGAPLWGSTSKQNPQGKIFWSLSGHPKRSFQPFDLFIFK